MKHIALSLPLITLLSSSVMSADSLESAFKEGRFDGQLRAFWTQRNYDYTTNSSDFKRDATTLGGKLGFETAPLYGISMGTRFYTANKIDNQIGTSATWKENDKTVVNTQGESFSVLGEAYIKASLGATTLKLGRQEINTPLLGTNDFRTVPNTYEAFSIVNTSIPSVNVMAMQVWSQNAGTFSNAATTELAALYGFGRGYDVGKFVSIDTLMLGTDAPHGTQGISAIGITYTPSSAMKVQLWDYYFHDLLNSVYAQIDLTTKIGEWNPYVAAQYIKQKNVGDNLMTKISTQTSKTKVNGQLYGVKVGVKYRASELSLTHQKTGVDANAVYGGGIISLNAADGFVTGMVTIHGNLANTTTHRVSFSQGLKEVVGHDVFLVANYIHYDIGKDNGYANTATWHTREYQADVIYKPYAKTDIRLRYAKVKSFAVGLDDITDMRLIGNYNF